MQKFEIKRGHGKTLENGGLKSLMEEEFETVEENGTLLTSSFKALTKIEVDFVSITEIHVETETDIAATPEDSLESHQAYNRFMQSVTSFNAKQRIDRAKARAKREAKAAADKEIAIAKQAKVVEEKKADEEISENENDEAPDEESKNEETKS